MFFETGFSSEVCSNIRLVRFCVLFGTWELCNHVYSQRAMKGEGRRWPKETMWLARSTWSPMTRHKQGGKTLGVIFVVKGNKNYKLGRLIFRFSHYRKSNQNKRGGRDGCWGESKPTKIIIKLFRFQPDHATPPKKKGLEALKITTFHNWSKFEASNLASLLESHGEAAEVEQLHRRVWKGRKTVLGAAHPKTQKLAAQKCWANGLEDETIIRCHKLLSFNENQRNMSKVDLHLVNTLWIRLGQSRMRLRDGCGFPGICCGGCRFHLWVPWRSSVVAAHRFSVDLQR